MELCKCTAVVNSNVFLYYRQYVACLKMCNVFMLWLILAPFDPLSEPESSLIEIFSVV